MHAVGANYEQKDQKIQLSLRRCADKKSRVAFMMPVHGTTKGVRGQTTYITSLFLPTHLPLLFLSSC